MITLHIWASIDTQVFRITLMKNQFSEGPPNDLALVYEIERTKMIW